jgi:3-dehydroquinate synthase
MTKFNIQGNNSKSVIYIGERLDNLRNYLPVNRIFIITDCNVRRLYEKYFPPYPVIEIGMGEEIKNLQTVEYIHNKLVEFEADRSCMIVAIGGGIVCDIAGFVASTFMRGIRFGFVSSTLLAQVDASVGGKNGVNLHGYKNLIGVFNQPEFVICDLNLLKTLPLEEIRCGFAEIVKHTLIADAEMFSYLEKNYEKAIELDFQAIEKLVLNSVEIKSDIVNMDETEKGERRKLNFGHTFGHAIEKTTGLPHGEAVSMGMVVASELSVHHGLLSPEDSKRIKLLLRKLGLPVEISFDKSKIIDALKKDKKRETGKIHFVLLNKIGNAVIQEIEITELEKVI